MSEYIDKCDLEFDEKLKSCCYLAQDKGMGSERFQFEKKMFKQFLKEKLEKQEIKHNRELVRCVEKSLEAQRKRLVLDKDELIDNLEDAEAFLMTESRSELTAQMTDEYWLRYMRGQALKYLKKAKSIITHQQSQIGEGK